MQDSGRQVRSPDGSLSDESDPSNKEEGSGGGAVRRSFECTYCKRGFTNAQALGGHMNIHRKDRAKAKQTTSATKKQATYNYADDQNHMVNYRQIAPMPSNSHKMNVGYANWEAQRIMAATHHMCRPVASVPDQVLTLPAGSYEPLRNNDHYQLGSNLSLRVSSAAAWNNNNNDENQEEEIDDEDVDLELRLGPR